MEISDVSRLMHGFVEAKGWTRPDSPRQQTPRNISVSLCLEAAEVLEHFQWGDNASDPEGLEGELADVALYLLQLASLTGVDLEKAILNKLEKNYQREWSS